MRLNIKRSNPSIKKHKSKIIEYIKFNAIGIANFVISQGVYLFLYLIIGLHYLIAYSITSVLSIIASYFLNSIYTFKDKNYSTKKFFLTIVIYIFEYALNFAVIWAFVNFLHMSKIVAPLIAPLFSTIPVFFMMRSVINKKHNKNN